MQQAFFSKTVSKDPIAISRLQTGPCLARSAGPEPAFAVIVYLSPIARLEGWIDGRPDYPEVNPGDVVLLDIEAHARIVRAYAPSRGPAKTVGLAPWQLQRAHEIMLANLAGEEELPVHETHTERSERCAAVG